jgi:hypothetical protein
MGKVKRTAIEQTEFMRNLLAFLLVGAFISCFPLFALVVVPEQNKDIIVYMVGQLSGMALTALGFYFVSKVGQDALDEKRAENTGEAFRAIASAAGTGENAAGEAAGEVADAAEDKADEIKGKPKRK